MKIFLSGLEFEHTTLENVIKRNIPIKWLLHSFFYIQKYPERFRELHNRHDSETLIDSGAYSLFNYRTKQSKKEVNLDDYFEEYLQFVKDNHKDPKIIGFFEMDIDKLVGYEKVLEYRKRLEEVTDKIIPVWHKNRGIKEFTKICQEYSGKTVAIASANKEDLDISDDQIILFLKEAWKYNCKLHGLGITRKKVIDNIPLDMVDSSSWAQDSFRGMLAKNKKRVRRTFDTGELRRINLEEWLKIQDKYYKKWSKINENKEKYVCQEKQ